MKKLQVPENISLRKEVWRGMSWPDFFKTTAITGVVLAVAISFCLISNTKSDKIIAVVAVTLAFVICAGLFSKLDSNQSIYDFYKKKLAFKQEQQVFHDRKGKEVYELVQKENRC